MPNCFLPVILASKQKCFSLLKKLLFQILIPFWTFSLTVMLGQGFVYAECEYLIHKMNPEYRIPNLYECTQYFLEKNKSHHAITYINLLSLLSFRLLSCSHGRRIRTQVTVESFHTNNLVVHAFTSLYTPTSTDLREYWPDTSLYQLQVKNMFVYNNAQGKINKDRNSGK